MTVTAKIGPWGAAGGTPRDINMYSRPRRLVSISIWSDDTPGGCIKGLSFTYVDQTNVPISVNIGGCSSSCIADHETPTIGAAWSTHCYRRGSIKTRYGVYNRDLNPSYVCGTTNETGVTSLGFHSQAEMIGPYGWPAGTEFSLSLCGLVGVAAFFGNSGDNHSLKSLGVYAYRPEPGPRTFPGRPPWGSSSTGGAAVPGRRWTHFWIRLDHPQQQDVWWEQFRVGPWGLTPHPHQLQSVYWDALTPHPHQLQSFTVCSSERSGGRIYGFSFTYLEEDGTSICAGPWGSNTKGTKRVFCMNKDNYITFMGGTHDEYGITSLRFISTQDVYGPFGCSIGTPFSMLLQDNAAAVGFFGACNSHIITSIGAHVVSQDDELDHTTIDEVYEPQYSCVVS